MRRILVLNPNSSEACTDTIRASLAPLQNPDGPEFDVRTLHEGPPAIASWADWHAVAAPLLRTVLATPADAYVIACVSDPAIDLLRAATARPVFGALRAGIAVAVARADRFGLVAFVPASVQRQRRVLQAMRLEPSCAAILPLDLPMDTLVHPEACRPRLLDVARALAEHGASALILGCAGMAGHRAWLEDATGLPVIEPVQSAAALALALASSA